MGSVSKITYCSSRGPGFLCSNQFHVSRVVGKAGRRFLSVTEERSPERAGLSGSLGGIHIVILKMFNPVCIGMLPTYICAPCPCVVLREARKGHQIPWKWRYRQLLSCHVGAKHRTQQYIFLQMKTITGYNVYFACIRAGLTPSTKKEKR